jgi:mannose-6-phosphate isomerase-like protein (cupin superfamily)
MKGFIRDLESLAINNVYFRQVLYTTPYSQLVLMSLEPKEEIGAETHKLVDQFFRVEEGMGQAIIDGVMIKIKAGYGMVIPAGTRHNIINMGDTPMKLYTIYSPPNHKDETIHKTKADAEADVNDHFDGKTTE